MFVLCFCPKLMEERCMVIEWRTSREDVEGGRRGRTSREDVEGGRRGRTSREDVEGGRRGRTSRERRGRISRKEDGKLMKGRYQKVNGRKMYKKIEGEKGMQCKKLQISLPPTDKRPSQQISAPFDIKFPKDKPPYR